MGRRLHYRPGSYYAVDDRTGFPQRVEKMRMEWTGLFVDERVWEARQPQDYVKGVKDDQSVPLPRPLSPDVFVGPIYTTLSAAAGAQTNIVVLTSVAGMAVGDEVGVMLATGVYFVTVIVAITGGSVTLGSFLPWPALSGASFVDYRIKASTTGSPFILDSSVLDGPDVLT